MAIIVAMGVGIATFWHTFMGKSTETRPDISEFPIRGIDISSHNGIIDFKQLADDSISFVFMKATEGKSFKDRNFQRNFVAAKKAGLKIGVYHFFRFDTPGDIQAINLLHSLRGKQLDLPVVIDVEEWTNPDNELPSNVIRRVRDMADYLANRGIPVMVYSNRDGYDKFLSREFVDFPLWICSLRANRPEHNWAFWQFSHNATIKAAKQRVDMNVFNGDSAAWESATKQWSVGIH